MQFLIEKVLSKYGKSEEEMEITSLIEASPSEDNCVAGVDDHFLCAICLSLVNDPVKCGGACESLFCRSCIESWCKRENSCPKKCEEDKDFKVISLVKFEKNTLDSLKFKCDKCGDTYTYEQKSCQCSAI
jgi:hypothetical protein